MPKKKTSKKHAFSLFDIPIVELKSKEGTSLHNASKRLKDKKFISEALWECLVENDIETFKEILNMHLELVNKEAFAKNAGISKRTLFRMLSPEGNPTLDNLGKIIHQLCA